MDKFNRNYKLTIETDTVGSTLVVAYPLTLEFSIRRECLSSAGTATFRIYNLGQVNRNKIFHPVTDPAWRAIKLEAGYGDPLSVVFNGFIQEAKSYRPEGQVNFITEITGYDIGQAMQKTTSDWNYSAPNNTFKYLINKIVTEDLKLPLGSMGSFKGVYALNGAFAKPAWEALKDVTDGDCYIDSGKVYCMKTNDAFDGAIPLINSDSGLLGSPRVNGNWIVFDMIFEPRLQIGQKVSLQSQSATKLNGDYKVISLEHSGTISGAVSGKCKTTVTLMLGSAGKEDPFDTVEEL